MTVLLSVVTVLAWGSWIPIAQAAAGIAQRVRALYVAVGNLVIATAALVLGGGELGLGWKQFWLPLAGGLVWVAGNYAAFRATDLIGLARAAGSWTPSTLWCRLSGVRCCSTSWPASTPPATPGSVPH